MFGNKECPKCKLNDITEKITKGTTPTTVGFSYENYGINFIKIESINDDGSLNFKMLSHINKSCYEKLSRSQLQEGDILFSIAGAIGKIAIVNKEILPANTNQALAIIRIKNNIIGKKKLSTKICKSFIFFGKDALLALGLFGFLQISIHITKTCVSGDVLVCVRR